MISFKMILVNLVINQDIKHLMLLKNLPKPIDWDDEDDDDEILGGLKDVRGKRVKRFGDLSDGYSVKI